MTGISNFENPSGFQFEPSNLLSKLVTGWLAYKKSCNKDTFFDELTISLNAITRNCCYFGRSKYKN